MSDAFTPPPAPQGAAPEDDKVLVIIGHIFPIVALVLWIINKDKPEKAYLIDQTKEATNFGITVFIGWIAVMFVGWIPLIGWLISLGFAIGVIVLIVMAVINVSKGNAHRYPFALRLIK